MSKSRIKINLPTLTTRSEAEAAMNELALAENNKRKFIANRDAAVLKITERTQPMLDDCDQFIAEKTEALKAWAETHPAEFPKGRKSINLVAGTLGFRTGTPKLALLSRAWNWEKVLGALQSNPLYKKFIRTKQEVDKEAILAEATASECFDPGYMGVKVVHDESFFIEPNLTDTESRQTA
jgi:phage host-nuclease inhibitor protein Gam